MSLEKSPSLDQFQDGMPSKLPDQKSKRKRIFTIMMTLVVIIITLGIINFLQSDTAAILSGTGTITGIVVDENGDPIEAEIYVLGTKVDGLADSDGYFIIDGVPSGNQSIAVAYQGSGFEYPVFIQPGESTKLGEIRFISTLEPHQ